MCERVKSMAVATTTLGTILITSFERVTATAGRNRIRIIDPKAAAHQAVYKVDGRATNIHNAGRVDDQAHAIHFDDGVEFLRCGLKSHAILQTRAATTCYEDTQCMIGNVALRKKLVNFRSGCWRNAQNVGLDICSWFDSKIYHDNLYAVV